jgi:ribosomal RNA assembly protein
MVYTLKVPLDRVGVIIGTRGSTLRLLKDRAGAQIEVDSETGEVLFHDEAAKDPYTAYRMRDVLRALGRGFSPEHSLLLLQDENYYEEFDIRDFSGKSRKRGEQVRSRLIGSDGRTRKLVEELTECLVSIKGNTVAIIGDLEGIKVASKAIELLLSGSEHSTVYSYMERKQRDLRSARSGF